ncbi:toll/interleukin-1 receptor domain-containing protein [Desulfosarcina ovata]|uniref:toll/interleukin-1 receptor domain-containing protein n=1 Tax=Desulfosarcina ovata TaxID=83564 RepID=UPI001565210C|nr:toll/interleukin-1 receptor domain-containing protein [Desulfosarcina ovata]
MSWSGERGKKLAGALREWLPMILQHIEPWLSDTDIEAGKRWSVEIARNLEESRYGIICLTRESIEAPWILFEAGAITKTLSSGLVCPYLLDLELTEISGPLAQFQVKKAERISTLQLVQSINKQSNKPLDEQIVIKLFDELWNSLESRINSIRKEKISVKEKRPTEEILEELISVVRTIERRFNNLDYIISEKISYYMNSPIESNLPDISENTHHIFLEITGSRVPTKDGNLLQKGKILKISIGNNSILEELDYKENIPAESYGKKWFIIDPITRKKLSKSQCDDILKYFNNKWRNLEIVGLSKE